MQDERPTRTADVTVIIPCRNERVYIEALLTWIGAQDPQPREIVLVDGGSTDGTVEAAQALRDKLAPIRLETIVAPELALPAALNCAVRKSTANYIIRLDGHSEPYPGYFARALEHLGDSRVGVVGGAWSIRPGDSSTCAAAIARAVSHPLGAGDAAYRLAHHRDAVFATDTVPFGCFTRQTWEAVGGFNELLIGNEDYEFNYRVRQRGLEVRFDAAIRSHYFARATLRGLALQYFRYGWCKVQMLRQHPQSLRWRQAVPVFFVTTLLVLAGASGWLAAARVALLALVSVYLAVLAIAAAFATTVPPRERVWLPIVFAVVHCAWGLGALVHVVTLGKWPGRALLFNIRKPATPVLSHLS